MLRTNTNEPEKHLHRDPLGVFPKRWLLKKRISNPFFAKNGRFRPIEPSWAQPDPTPPIGPPGLALGAGPRPPSPVPDPGPGARPEPQDRARAQPGARTRAQDPGLGHPGGP